jgi:hypothetical protein
MNANEVLIDLLEDNRRRLLRLFDAIPDECISWKPDPQSNNIAVTVWHMGRIFDVFMVQQAQGRPPEEDCWFRYGWAEQTGYDPRSIGQNGWGMLTGYTLEETAAVPQLPRDQLLKYLNQVYDSVKKYLNSTTIETLLTPGAGFEGRYSKYQCVQMALMDNIRHLGDIYTLKNRWERER